MRCWFCAVELFAVKCVDFTARQVMGFVVAGEAALPQVDPIGEGVGVACVSVGLDANGSFARVVGKAEVVADAQVADDAVDFLTRERGR